MLQKPAPMDLQPTSHGPFAKVMIGHQKCRCDGLLCAHWHLCSVSYPTLEGFFGILDPNVSCATPSFDLESPALALGVLVNVEKLVEAR